MSAMQRLYSVQEAAADPFAIPDSPFRFVEIRDRFDTYVVLAGSVRIGTVRHDAGSGLFVAKTTGCPNGSAPADIHRNFATRIKAAEWLSRAIDGVQPRRRHGSKGVLAAAGLALLLTASASAQELRSDAANWVLPVVDGETPLRPIDPPPARPVQLPEPPKASLPPPGNVVEALSALRLSCREWQIGPTPGYETEAHVCNLLAGHDTAYGDGAIAGSWMTAAFGGGIWLVLRLPDWLLSLLALVRRRRATP